MLGATMQNLVTWVTGHLGFMHPWIRQYQGKSVFSYVILAVFKTTWTVLYAQFSVWKENCDGVVLAKGGSKHNVGI